MNNIFKKNIVDYYLITKKFFKKPSYFHLGLAIANLLKRPLSCIMQDYIFECFQRPASSAECKRGGKLLSRVPTE